MIQFSPGFIPSPFDPRDATMPMTSSEPREVIAQYMPPIVYDQGKYGMCVAFALSLAIAAQEIRQRGKLVEVSPGYIYGNRLETQWQGEGMIPRDALKMAMRFGVVKKAQLPESGTYPFCKTVVSSRSRELDGEGIPQRIKGYVRLSDMADVCSYIERFGLPVLVGMTLRESFYQTGTNGIVPAPSGNVIGGHEMVLVGTQLHDGKLMYLGQNSWGRTWGLNGRFLLDPNHYSLEMWGIIPEDAPDIIAQPRQIMLTIGSTTLVTDAGSVALPQAPTYVNGKFMIPVRECLEALGFTVKWYRMTDGRDVVLATNGGEIDKIENV